MLEGLLAALIPVAAKMLYDRVRVVRDSADDLVRKAARAVFPRVVGTRTKQQAKDVYLSLLGASLAAVDVRFTEARRSIAVAIFDQLWSAHARLVWDNAMADLAAAGKRAGQVAAYLERTPK